MAANSSGDPFPSHPDTLLDSRRLRLFVVSAREESFAAAAAELNLSPSAISHSMKALEQDLDCELFRRSGPRVELTPAGRRLLPLAEQLLVQMTRLREEVIALEAATRRLTVAVPSTICSELLPIVLPDFQDSFPSVQLQVLCGAQDPGILTADPVDVSIGPIGGSSPVAVKRELFAESLQCYVAPFHLLRNSALVGPADLRRHLLLVPDEDCRSRVLRVWHPDGEGKEQRIWTLPDLYSIRELARVGQGIAILPAWTMKEGLGSLMELPVEGMPMQRSCYATWPRDKPLSWAAEVFLSLVEMAAADRNSNLSVAAQATAAVDPDTPNRAGISPDADSGKPAIFKASTSISPRIRR